MRIYLYLIKTPAVAKILRQIFLLLVFFTIGFTAYSQKQEKKEEVQEKRHLTRILFVFDASQSMYGRWQSDLKINIARNILLKVLDSLKSMPDLELGLRLYGHQYNFP